MAFRDTNVVIIEVARTTIRAGFGVHELLRKPTIDFPAKVGIRRDLLIASQTNGHSNGGGEPSASTSVLPSSKVGVKDYLVGSQLEDALARGEDLFVSYPFENGDVKDFTQAEAIWKYLLFTQLQLRRTQNESPVILSFFPCLSRDTYERICQVFFERFNVLGFAILERPISQMYATSHLTGIVIDMSEEFTDITPIYEGFLVRPGRTSVALGTRHCYNYLASLLKYNQGIINALSPPENPLAPETLHNTLIELVKQMVQDGHIKVPSDGETASPEDEGVTDIAAVVVAGREKAVIESGMKKKATAKASAAEQARAREIEALDLITVQFREHSLTVGKERHRFCEPLFDPHLLVGHQGTGPLDPSADKPLPLQDIVAQAINQTEIPLQSRQYLWQGLFVTGEITRYVKGIAVALQSRVAPFIISPDVNTEMQPRSTRILSVPEFYAEYRDTGNGYAAFLGSSISAKIIFINEPNMGNIVSKADYSNRGPHSIIDASPALL